MEKSDPLLEEQNKIYMEGIRQGLRHKEINGAMRYSKHSPELLRHLLDARKLEYPHRAKIKKEDLVKILCEADRTQNVWMKATFEPNVFSVHEMNGTAIIKATKAMDDERTKEIAELFKKIENLVKNRSRDRNGGAQMLEANNSVLRTNSENITPPDPSIINWQGQMQHQTRVRTYEHYKRFTDELNPPNPEKNLDITRANLYAENYKKISVSAFLPFESILSNGPPLGNSSGKPNSDSASGDAATAPNSVKTPKGDISRPSGKSTTTRPIQGSTVTTPISAPSKGLPATNLPAKGSAKVATKPANHAAQKTNMIPWGLTARSTDSKNASDSSTISNSHAGNSNNSSMSNNFRISHIKTEMSSAPGNLTAQNNALQTTQDAQKRDASRPPTPSQDTT